MSTHPPKQLLVEYRNRVISLLRAQASLLSADQMEQVRHLIVHNEHGVALEYLARYLVERGAAMDVGLLAEIGELASGLVAEEDMPVVVRPYLR